MNPTKASIISTEYNTYTKYSELFGLQSNWLFCSLKKILHINILYNLNAMKSIKGTSNEFPRPTTLTDTFIDTYFISFTN